MPAVLDRFQPGPRIALQHFCGSFRLEEIGRGTPQDKNRALNLVPCRPKTVPVVPRRLEAKRQAPIITKHVVAGFVPLYAMSCEMPPVLVREWAERLQYFPEVTFYGLEIWKSAW